MDLKARVDVFTGGRRKFSVSHCDLVPLQIFIILISLNIKAPFIFYTKFQNFIGFAVFSIGGHLGSSTRLNFTTLKPCSLIMLHVKFEIRGCRSFKE